MTEDTETIRESILYDPLDHLAATANLYPMRVAAAMDVIYCKKLESNFTAACAFTPIMLDYLSSFSAIKLSL